MSKLKQKLPTLPDEQPISPTRCAEQLGHSSNVIAGVIEQNFNRLITIQFPNSKRIKVFASQIQHCLENPLPDDEAEEAKKFNQLGNFMEADEDENVDEYEDEEGTEYRIYKNQSLKERWGRMPTDEEIEENFGPGKYRIVAYNLERELVLKARCVDITDAAGMTTASPLLEMSKVIENSFDRIQRMNQNQGGGGNGNGDLYKHLLEENRKLNEKLFDIITKQVTQQPQVSPAAAGGVGMDLPALIAMITQLKDAGSIFDNKGTNQFDLIKDGLDRFGDLLEALLPNLVENYKMGKIPTDDLKNLPHTEYVPALAGPNTQQPAMKGGDATEPKTESQTLRPIELDLDSKGEGEKEI